MGALRVGILCICCSSCAGTPVWVNLRKQNIIMLIRADRFAADCLRSDGGYSARRRWSVAAPPAAILDRHRRLAPFRRALRKRALRVKCKDDAACRAGPDQEGWPSG
jgi:hypothetical protein